MIWRIEESYKQRIANGAIMKRYPECNWLRQKKRREVI